MRSFFDGVAVQNGRAQGEGGAAHQRRLGDWLRDLGQFGKHGRRRPVIESAVAALRSLGVQVELFCSVALILKNRKKKTSPFWNETAELKAHAWFWVI